ncbi:MAG: isochorismatase family protein [Marinobacter sp.]|uniref:isochorismatase family protein n=1 Tax=Marinobacter sp. TaxID=50741 RepID=UPI00299EAA38|nr:isochorismatase family protein [Marinobacter sp.]MDX1634872.1 isochorismatase family protein [Marinobacter sp.]
MTEQTPDALLLVDIQNDFCKGGALEVPDSPEIFAAVNRYIKHAQRNDWLIVASRDWHPVDHCSFEDQGGPWPEHCVQDTKGAEFHPDMELPDDAVRVSKGAAFDRDQYSAFDDTGLADFLRQRGVKRLHVAGLALDVCVDATVRDALKEGFEVKLLADGTRAVEADKAGEVLDRLSDRGAEVVS